MEVVWYPKDRKHWRSNHDVWLCFKRPRNSSALGVVLHEGSHHYFTEMHITRPNKPPAGRHLDGPGPFEVEFDGMGDCCVVVRTRFLSYSRQPIVPGASAENVHAELCASIIGDEGDEPVMMQITQELSLLNTTCRMPDLDEIIRRLTATPTSLIKLLPSTVPPYFRLAEPSDVPTEVFHLNDSHLDPGIQPESELPAEVYEKLAAFPQTVIPAGQPAPLTVSLAKMPAKPAVVFPVREIRNRRISGKPLALLPLIKDFRVRKRAPSLTASWEWAGPLNWLIVRLTWRAYDNYGNWEEHSRQQRDVRFAEYNQRNNIQILNISDYWGWNVVVTAWPYFVGDPPKDDDESPPPFSTTIAL